MQSSPLTALSPLDGRYAEKLSDLRTIFSEMGLIRARMIIELRWLEALADQPDFPEVPTLNNSAKQLIEQMITHFKLADAEAIKKIEQTTHHDVKAVEYFIKQKFESHPELKKVREFIHFACTSDDINNLAYALILQEAREKSLLPAIETLIQDLTRLAHTHADLPMLARTHGQPATPTTLGKEFANFTARLKRLHDAFTDLPLQGKFNGTVGCFNAHMFTYPKIDWLAVTQQFVERLGFHYNAYTTQIEPHDSLAEFCQQLAHINTVLIDLSRDMWGYISLGYFTQAIVPHSVGSSVMPHKVNPIYFENAEGNFGIANALLQHMTNKLPTSRWQRDLTDSTTLRNLGTALGHSLLAYRMLAEGLQGLAPNVTVIAQDLDQHWEVLSEAIQTLLRKQGIDHPYEILKKATQGKILNRENLHAIIDEMDIPDATKNQLKNLSPQTYLGYASALAKKI